MIEQANTDTTSGTVFDMKELQDSLLEMETIDTVAIKLKQWFECVWTIAGEAREK